MSRVLFLTELLPYPLVAGPKTRAYFVLRHLAAKHRVTLVSFVRPDDRPEWVAHLRSFLHEVHTVPMERSPAHNLRAGLLSLFTGRSAIILREEIRPMRDLIERLLATGDIDVVHADQIPMAQYGLLGHGARVKRLLDQHNATFQIIERLAQNEPASWKRFLLRREARAFSRYEPEVCDRFDFVTFVTSDDREALLSRTPGGSLNCSTSIIPICQDTETSQPVKPVPKPMRVTHIGTMFWPPNIEGVLWFWEKVWPQVQERVPQATLTLIGKNPTDRIQALAADQDVEVPGYVPDLAPYLEETAAFIVPLHAAGGMRVKIVDAWCWGLPIVSTTIGAEGIKTRNGENILIADSPADFASAIVRLLREPLLQARLRTSGRSWVEERYDWRRVYGRWDEVYADLV